MTSRAVLVTGSTDGVGRTVAVRLAGPGTHLFVHGRDRQRGEAVTREIAAAGGTAEFLEADLASLANVRALADAVRRRTDRLHLLVNNAGIGSGGKGATRQTSDDGSELRFAVNYLAGFLLTHLLLPLLKAHPPSRIVNVSSIGQAPINFDDVMLERSYDGSRAYMQSKLAQVMFTIDLAATLDGSGVTVNCLHPATYMNTTMVRQAGVTPLSTVEQGAKAILELAQSPALERVSGRFFNGLQEAQAHRQAYDAGARRQLRALSETLTALPV
jgi:NAD(P)-dependent dehydrogenase (short-subunit alcohol dehydrogenase family)